MNTQIQDFITANESKILEKVGQTVATRAIVILDENIKKTTEVLDQWFEDTGKVIKHELLDEDFQTLIKSIIKGEPIAVVASEMAINIAKNQIIKAIKEFEVSLEKE